MPKKREGMSQRLRFEVMKRDGFTCRYCGANAMSTVLEVDHVVAVANGGTNDPANLITACKACNGGKSDVPLNRSQIATATSTVEIREHAKQVKAYLAACEELQCAKASVTGLVARHWNHHFGADGMPQELLNSLPYWVSAIGVPKVLEAVEATARRRYTNRPKRYFIAVVRNMRDGQQAAAQ